MHRFRIGRGGEDDGKRSHARAAVDAGVVHLDVNREAAALETLDHVVLPERSGAIEQDHVQSRNQGLELLARSRLWQGDVAEMIVEIEIVVVDPDRMIELNRRQGQLALKERNEMKPALEMVTEHRENIGICGGGSKIASPATCIGDSGVSPYRKLASRADNLSMASSIRFEAVAGSVRSGSACRLSALFHDFSSVRCPRRLSCNAWRSPRRARE